MSSDVTTPPGSQKAVLAGSVLPEASHLQPNRAPNPGSASRTRERLVLASMALVTAAASAALFALFDFSLSAAVLAGGLIWASLMTLHLQIKKNAEIAHLKSELARHEAARVNIPKDSPEQQQRANASVDIAKPRQPSSRKSTLSQPATAAAERAKQGDAPQSVGAIDGTPVEAGQGPEPHPRWEHAEASKRPQSSPRAAAAPRPLETALWPGTSLSVADPMRDQWAFRPRDNHEMLPKKSQAHPVAPVAAEMPALAATKAAAQGVASIDTDLEMVQRKIKALADEVNAAELLRDRIPQQGTQTPTAVSAIEKSVGALKATADTMRERPQAASRQVPQHEPIASLPAGLSPLRAPARSETAALPRSPAADLPEAAGPMPLELMIPATAERIAVSNPVPQPASIDEPADFGAPDIELTLPSLSALQFTQPLPPPNPRMAAIVAAVENGEMDVFLSPIVALQSHQVSHYDVTVRLKGANGSYLDGAEEELRLAGSDVLALFDIARLKRSAALAQRLDAHNKPGSLLSAVNGPSITNGDFLETFARVYEDRDRISNQLVLTFTQTDIEQFTPSAWQALSDMHAFGFRFALSKIDHVSLDFANLAARGFAFLRLDADALLKGLPARDRFMAADELCRHLAGSGMTLVADTIEDEAVRARIFGFGILFGQGRLFGGARQVKLDPLPAGSSAAA